jgi:rare lipoprotein A
VTNLENGRSLELRVNDRGPFKRGRIIDVSRRSARLLGFLGKGTAKIRVEILADKSRQLAALAHSRDAAGEAPRAAPTVEVTAVPLKPLSGAENGAGSVGAFTPAVSALGAPIGSVAGSWMLESEDGQVESLSPAAGSEQAKSKRVSVAAVGPVPWPDGTVSLQPVRKTNIFVQAGSFLRRDNATRLSARLSVLARSKVTQALVGEKVFFRVRLGPIASVNDADRLLQTLSTNGINNAQVVVD